MTDRSRYITIAVITILLLCGIHGRMVSGDEPVNRVYLPLSLRSLSVRGAYDIAFVSDRDSNDEIYVMDENGAFLTNVSNHVAEDTDPAWSPDGQKLAFVSDRDGNDEIYVVNRDGVGLINVTHDSDRDWDPVWSPDGSKIAFMSDREGGAGSIWVMNADGSAPLLLVHRYSLYLPDDSPTWSPDSQRIAYRAQGDGSDDIYAIRVDASDKRQLTATRESERSPQWSLDGQSIAFTRDFQIFVMHSDGSNVRCLTPDHEYCWSPRWSPDSRQIAFNTSGPTETLYDQLLGGPSNIYVVDADGSNPTRAVWGWGTSGSASWLPDGKRFVYPTHYGPDNQEEVGIVSLDGSVDRMLTRHPADDWAPVCSPRS